MEIVCTETGLNSVLKLLCFILMSLHHLLVAVIVIIFIRFIPDYGGNQ